MCDALKAAVASTEMEGGMSGAEKAYMVELKRMGRTLKNNIAPGINQVCGAVQYVQPPGLRRPCPALRETARSTALLSSRRAGHWPQVSTRAVKNTISYILCC
jgi:hypothetical protein